MIENGYELDIHLLLGALKSVFALSGIKVKDQCFYYSWTVFGKYVYNYLRTDTPKTLTDTVVTLRSISSFLVHLSSMTSSCPSCTNMCTILNLVSI